jgi:hypothetical protein
MNVIEMLNDRLTDEVIGPLARHLGESAAATRAVLLKGAIPAVLAGLAQTHPDTRDAGRLEALLSSGGHDGALLEELPGALAGGATAATVLLTYLYNGLLKHGPLGPLAMGACRFGNAGIGLAAMGVVAPTTWALPLGTLAYVAAVTGVSRHEAHGEVTGRLHAALVALPVLALFPMLLVGLGALPEPAGLAAACAAPLWLAQPVRRAWNGGPGPVRGAVMAGIFGIPLVNAALCVGAGAFGLSGLIAGFAVAGRMTGRRFYAT